MESRAGVVLLGPRQVGKTTLAQDIAASRDAVYLDLERAVDRQVLEEPDLYLDEQVGRLVVIDEVQLMADMFKYWDPGLRGTVRGHFASAFGSTGFARPFRRHLKGSVVPSQATHARMRFASAVTGFGMA